MYIDADLSDRLHGVGVQEQMLLTCCTPLFYDICNLSDRLERADLVVGVHYRDQDRFIGQRLFKVLDAHDAF